LPDFAAAFLQQGRVAEGAARRLFSIVAAHAFAHQLLGALFSVQAHFLGEIVIEFTATEDVRNPVHGKLLLAGLRSARIQDQGDAFEHAVERGNLLLEVAKTRGCDLVGSDPAIG
jgi:hypothetical protein